jgi:TetR/AcrR family transcriptional regulator
VKNNRLKLLECALELFSSRGYDAVGVQAVADAAGLKKPTLYHYFGSKSGLLKTLLDTHFEELFMALEKAADYQGDVKTTLTTVCAEYFDFAQKNRSFYRMQLAMWFSPPNSDSFRAVAVINARQQQILEGLFLKAAQDHGNMRGRHQAYAATLLGMVNTYIALGLNDFTVLDAELVSKAVHQFMHGIFS